MYRRLRFLREKNIKKQQDIANLLEIVKSQYCNYETEKVTIPIKHLITLCNYYNVSLDYIFEFTNIEQYETIKKETNKTLMGKRLKELRKEFKLTQTDLSNFLNTTFSTISSYERGVNIISTNYLYSISKKYHISTDYLLGRIDKPKYLKNDTI